MSRRQRRSHEPPPPFVNKLNTIGSHQRIVKTIGSMALLKAMTERLGLRALLESIIPMQRDVGITHDQVVEAMVINRCLAPVPLYDIAEWAHESGDG